MNLTKDNMTSEFQYLPWMDGAKKISLLHFGKWANANVYLFCKENQWFVRKGFCMRSFMVRWTIGIFLTWREAVALRRLSAVAGVPAKIKRCSPFSLRYQYLEGETLSSIRRKKEWLPKSYFLEAESILTEIHKRKMVHLDLRRASNWVVQRDGKPGIIDFQSMISVALLPHKLQAKLFNIDYSGLYKLWKKMCKEPLDPERQVLLNKVNRMRRFWIFKGYLFQKLTAKK
jgi:hypothetical protein